MGVLYEVSGRQVEPLPPGTPLVDNLSPNTISILGAHCSQGKPELLQGLVELHVKESEGKIYPILTPSVNGYQSVVQFKPTHHKLLLFCSSRHYGPMVKGKLQAFKWGLCVACVDLHPSAQGEAPLDACPADELCCQFPKETSFQPRNDVNPIFCEENIALVQLHEKVEEIIELLVPTLPPDILLSSCLY